MVLRVNILCLILLLLFAVSCSSGGNGTSPVPAGNETQIILPSGGGAIFPAGSFAAATNVIVTEAISGAMGDAGGFPAGSGALLGATTIEVPAGVALASDIEVRIALSMAQATDSVFTIYSFNEESSMWETTAATSSAKGVAATGPVSGGTVVSFTAPTAGTTGLDVSYGVFANLKTTDPGGGGGTTDPNGIPAVSLSADATTVDPGVTVNLTATGTDPDGDDLTFSWLAAAGTLGTPATTGGTSTVTWSAATGGSYVVSVSANDGNGGVDTDAVTITVNTPSTPVENNAPVVGELEKNVTHVYTTQEVHLSTTATDEDGDTLTITWSGPGTFSDQAYDAESGEATATWIGDTAGSTELTVTADDGVAATSATASATLTFDVTAFPTEFTVVGVATCAGCHADTNTAWLTTAHASAIENSILTNSHAGEHCFACHAAGFDPVGEGGFISYDTTPQFANIQCEACHGGGVPAGAGSGHKPNPWNPGKGYQVDAEGNYVEVDGVFQYDEDYDGAEGYGCGLCHEGSRHGSFEEWEESGHANIPLTEDDGEGGLAVNHDLTNSSCNPCHSGMQFGVIHNGDEALDLSTLTVDDPLKDQVIGCATCHDPHSNEYEAQLRMDSAGTVDIPFSDTDGVPTTVGGAGTGTICIECHNGRRDRGDYDGQMASGSGHFGPHGNPQGPVLYGLMGADLGETPMVIDYDTEHPHLNWNENSCTTCHMYRRDYISSDEPALWGHNFIPRFERCVECHGNFAGDEEAFWLWVEEYKAEIQAMMDAFLAAWPAEWMEDGEPVNRDTDPATGVGPARDDAVGAAYRAALWNYYLVMNDSSMGVHNPAFTKSLLEEATASVIELNSAP